jgi:hypothetical protein
MGDLLRLALQLPVPGPQTPANSLIFLLHSLATASALPGHFRA